MRRQRGRGWRRRRPQREGRVVGDLLSGRDRRRTDPRTTAAAEPGVLRVVGAAARATHPVTSVTYLAGRGLITSRDPIRGCDNLGHYRMSQILDRVLTAARQ